MTNLEYGNNKKFVYVKKDFSYMSVLKVQDLSFEIHNVVLDTKTFKVIDLYNFHSGCNTQGKYFISSTNKVSNFSNILASV